MSLGSLAELTILITARDEARRVLNATKDDLFSLKGAASAAGLGLAAIGAGFVAASVEGIQKSMQFEQSLKDIHTQAGASDVNLNDLNKTLRAMGPALGTTPNDLAEMLYHIYSAGQLGAKGVVANKNALDELTATTKLAKIGHADYEATANTVIATMAQYPQYLGHASEATAQLNAIIGSGNMRMNDLARAFGTGLPAAAKAAGLQLGDIGAGLATLTDLGIPAEQSATKLRMAFALFAAPSGAAAKALQAIGLSASETNTALAHRDELAKYGIHMTDLASDLRKPQGLLVALQDLKHHMETSGLTAVEQSAVIFKAFGGGRTATGVQALYENLDRLALKYDQQKGIAKDFNNDWTATTENVRFKLDQFHSAWDSMMIGLGDAERPILVRVLPAVTNLVTWVSDRLPAAFAKASDYFSTHLMPVLSRFGDYMNTTGVPALQRLGGQVEHIGSVLLPLLASGFGFVSDHLGTVASVGGTAFGLLMGTITFLTDHIWLVEAASAAWLARWVEIKALDMATWVVGMMRSFAAMAGEQGVGSAVAALGGLGGTGGLSGSLRALKTEAAAVAAADALPAVEGALSRTAVAAETMGTKMSAGPMVNLPGIGRAAASAAPEVEKAAAGIESAGVAAAGAGVGFASLATLGLPLLIGGAVALWMNWDKVTNAFHGFLDPAWAASQAVKAVNDQIAATNNAAGSAMFQGLTNDTAGFTKAITGSHQAMAGGFHADMTALFNDSQKLSGQIKDTAASTQTWVAEGNGAGYWLKGTTQDTDNATAALRAQKGAVDANIDGLNRLMNGFDSLSPAAQGTINKMREYVAQSGNTKDGVAAEIAAFDALKGVQDAGIPSWDAQGRATGIATQGTDGYSIALQEAARKFPALHDFAMQALGDWQAQGGAMGVQAGKIQSLFPQYDSLRGKLEEQAKAHGDTKKAQEDWVNSMLDKVNPELRKSGDAIGALAKAWGTDTSTMMAMIAVNPRILTDFLATQQRAQAVADATHNVADGLKAAGFAGKPAAAGIQAAADAVMRDLPAAVQQAWALAGAINAIPSNKNVHINVSSTGVMSTDHKALMAGGGYVTQATSAIIGEAGPEWVIPRRDTPDWMAPMLDQILAGSAPNTGHPGSAGGGGLGGGGNSTVVPVTINLDGKVIARVVAKHQGANLRLQNMSQGGGN